MTASSSSLSSNFQLIINDGLNKYQKRTKNDLRAHPLAVQLQACDSPDAILVVLSRARPGAKPSHFVHRSSLLQTSDERWTNWPDPAINVLYAFSTILGAGVGLVCLTARACMRSALIFMSQLFSPASAIFAGVGVLLSARMLNDFAWAFVTCAFLRLLKMFDEPKTLLSTFLNASKCFSDDDDTEVQPTSDTMNTAL
jgi:hypothetical protein